MVGAVGFTNSLHTKTLLPKSFADFEIDPTNRANRANRANPQLSYPPFFHRLWGLLRPVYSILEIAAEWHQRPSLDPFERAFGGAFGDRYIGFWWGSVFSSSANKH
jgi:hypothetical protein